MFVFKTILALIKFRFIYILLILTSCTTQNTFLKKAKKSNISTEDFIALEAENTDSNKGKWQVVKESNPNYVKDASQKLYLEFMGNKPITGKPNSPLEYKFTAPKSGKFKLMLMTSKRLEGVRSDWCNDAFVKLNGDFESASSLSTEDLKKNIKFLQDGNDEAPELKWHWASTAEKERHTYYQIVYNLKEKEEYTLTISGRSQRFSVDYIVLFNVDKISEEQAKTIFKL